MGECCSKENQDFASDPRRSSRISRGEGGGFSDIRVDSATRDDEQIVEVLRREFRENPQNFLLNNLLMAMQFFENHSKDRESSLANKMEKELNTTLLKNETMECICPDVLLEVVNKNLRYRPLHGTKKFSTDPLLPRRLFVINDTIEVIDTMDVPQYTSIDKPAYQVRIEESSRKGFVRLKQIDTNKNPKIYAMNFDEPGPSGLQTPESDYYAYTSITDLKTPKPLDAVDGLERRDTLPITCFACRKVKKPDHELHDLQDNDKDVTELTEEDLFNKVVYIDAKGFMNYFKNELFPISLGKSLGFTRDEIDLAKAIPGKVFCNLNDEDNPIPCEVIPSVAIQWPAAQTFEFIMREDRPTITDKNTGIRYKWPTDQMIKEMRSFNCVVVPKGYWLKKGKYSDATLEWEIAFPKAERYLEARMSHAQMRCFLFLVVLHKTLIEPVTQHHGLLVEHIRCHMFWECEANYRDWPEHRLGTKLLKVLENLNQRISKSELPDFFIKQRNHFRNIPKKYLQFAQKVFHDIQQSPVMYFIRGLRCVRYSSGKFYPPFDYKELYRMLTQTQGYKLVNPNLMSGPPNLRKKRYVDPEMQWEHLQEQNRRKKFLERKEREIKRLQQQEEEEDKISVDSIDIDWICEKQFEVFKTKAILTQFIQSFIAIAQEIPRFYGTENQTLLYLKQASYLNKILESTSPAFKPDCREFVNQIYLQQEAVQKSAVLRISDVPPETPVRNSIQFDFQINQQLKNNSLNLNNLHNSYNNGSLKIAHTPSIKLRLKSPVLRAKSEHRSSIAKNKRATNSGPRKTVGFIEPPK